MRRAPRPFAISTAAPRPCTPTKPSCRAACASRQPAIENRTEPFSRRRARPPFGERLQRVRGLSGPIALDRRCIRDSSALGLGEEPGVAGGPRLEEEGAVRSLGRPGKAPIERMHEDRGPVGDHRRRVAPEAEGEPQPEVRGADGVRAFTRQERCGRRHTDHHRVDGLGQLDSLEERPAQQRLRMRDGRRAAEHSSCRDRTRNALEAGLAETTRCSLQDAPEARAE